QYRYRPLDRLWLERIHRYMAGFFTNRHCFLDTATKTETSAKQRGSCSRSRSSENRYFNASITAGLAYYLFHGTPLAALLQFDSLVASCVAGLGNGIRGAGMGTVVYPIDPASHCLHGAYHRWAPAGPYPTRSLHQWH